MHTISIIIPTLNEADSILNTLENIQGLRKRGHEVILVDGGSTDNTATLAKPYVDRLLFATAGRATQMNHGAEHCSGSILIFLHADTLLPAEADQYIHNALTSRSQGWGRFNARLNGKHSLFKVISTLMNIRSKMTGIATGDQAIFISRDLFFAAGKFPNIAIMEDIALSRQLRKTSWPISLSAAVTTSSRRWQNHGVIRTIVKMWCLRCAYFLGVDPNRLAKHY